jgi:hypothetical protein
MKLTPLGITRLQAVKQHILEEPRRLNMFVWGIKTNPELAKQFQHLPPCGTVGCIAGWTLLLFGPPIEELTEFRNDDGSFELGGSRIVDQAANLLELDPWEANDLFHVNNWPEPFKDHFIAAISPRSSAQILADAIDDFIARGSQESPAS